MTNQNSDTLWARQVLIAVKKRGLYAHNVIQASHGRGVFNKSGNLTEWRTRLIEAAIADGLPENEIPSPPCDYCDEDGRVETDNNGPIGPCPICGGTAIRTDHQDGWVRYEIAK